MVYHKNVMVLSSEKEKTQSDKRVTHLYFLKKFGFFFTKLTGTSLLDEITMFSKVF